MKIKKLLIIIISAVAALVLINCKNNKTTIPAVEDYIAKSEQTIATATVDISLTDGGVKVRGYKKVVEIGEESTLIRIIESKLTTTQELKETETQQTVTDFNRADLITFSFEKYLYESYNYANGKLTATVDVDRVDNVIGQDVIAISDGTLEANFENNLIKDFTFTYTMEGGKIVTMVASYQYKS